MEKPKLVVEFKTNKTDVNNTQVSYNTADFISEMKSFASKIGEELSKNFKLEYKINEDTLLEDELNIDLTLLVPDDEIEENDVNQRIDKDKIIKLIDNLGKDNRLFASRCRQNSDNCKTLLFEKIFASSNAPMFKIRFDIQAKSTYQNITETSKYLTKDLKYRYICSKLIAYNKSLQDYENIKRERDEFLERLNEGRKKGEDLGQIILEKDNSFPKFLKSNIVERKFIKAKCQKLNRWYGLRVEKISDGWKVVDMFILSDEDAALLFSEIQLPYLTYNNNYLSCLECHCLDKCECSCVKSEEMKYQYCLNCKEFKPDYSNNLTDDIAFGKPVMELCNHPEFLTDGTVFYSGNDFEIPGYLGTHWPTFVTVDLLETKKINAICFKLWDWNDPCNIISKNKRVENKNMEYAYRLLVSADRREWIVLFDSSDDKEGQKYKRGWQCFSFAPINIRYIRIHCLKNNKNSGFHLVHLKAYNNIKNPSTINFKQCNSTIKEKGDGVPLSFKLINLAGKIQDIKLLCDERRTFLQHITNESNGSFEKFLNSLLNIFLFNTKTDEYNFFSARNKEYDDDIVNSLFRRAHEVDVAEGEINEIKNLVVEPIKGRIADDINQNFKDFLWEISFNLFCFILTIYICSVNNNFIFSFIYLTILIIYDFVLIVEYIYSIKGDKIDKSDSYSQNLQTPLPLNKFEPIKIYDSKGDAWCKEDNNPIDSKGISVLSLPSFDLDIDRIFYNEEKGFYSIKVPGWVEFDFGTFQEIKYIRFLLWDNNGTKKRTRSHRFYNYRIIYRANETESWNVLHDTMGRGSSGWQEFINRQKNPWKIRYIRLYGISNSGTIGGDKLMLVRFGISSKFENSDIKYTISNSIIKYDNTSDHNYSDFIMKSINWLKEINEQNIIDRQKWEELVNKLTSSCGNMNAEKVFGSINSFIKSIITKEYFLGSTEDFVSEIRSLIEETVTSIKKEYAKEKQIQPWMIGSKICLIDIALIPIMIEFFGSNMDNNSLSGLFLAEILQVIAICMIINLYLKSKNITFWRFICSKPKKII